MPSDKDFRVTPTHVYFHGGPPSQWHYSDTVIHLPTLVLPEDGSRPRLKKGDKSFVFKTNEHYMMASKAAVFGDIEKAGTLERIIGTKALFNIDKEDLPEDQKKWFFEPARTPKDAKAIGRQVPGLKTMEWDENDIEFWDRASDVAVLIGTLAKFTQSDSLYDFMVRMGDRAYVEGSAYDTIWGVGIDFRSSKIEDERNWLGRNKLGNVMNLASAHILEHGRDIDPWKAAAAIMREQKSRPNAKTSQNPRI